MAAIPPASPLDILNAYMDVVLQITDQAARDALNAQGLRAISDFEALSEDDIAEICSNARKPGGMIPNPNPLGPPLIANPGIMIGHLAEKRLKMFRYFVIHLNKVNRTFVGTVPNLADLQTLYQFKESETEHDNEIPMPEKLTSIENIRVVLEDLDHYLESKRGVTGIPLAAYTRSDPNVAPENEDPTFGAPTILAEMIRRAPHTGPTYATDNLAVWDVVRHITHDGPGWGWVQPFARSRNGRAAYQALRTHYLGDAFQSRLRAKADQTLESVYYDGAKRNFTYERFIETLQRAFTDLESTGEAVSEERKVRILLTGIADARLESAKNQILATPTLRATFETASNFLAEVLDSKVSYSASNRKQARISSIQSQNKGKGRNNNGRNNKKNEDKEKEELTDRYYTPKEWSKLSGPERQRVREVREERDKRRGVASLTSQPRKKAKKDAQNNDTPDVSEESSDEASRGIGAIMSQRKKKRNSESL